MPWREYVKVNVIPYINLIATVLGIVAEVLRSYVRHANAAKDANGR